VEAWRELVKTEAVERERVEPVKGVAAVKAAPLIVLTVSACVEVAIEYVIPETWRRDCGVDVPIPMFPVWEMRIVSERL
jgi:hypothetical protein